jgi:hypothetical protein
MKQNTGNYKKQLMFPSQTYKRINETIKTTKDTLIVIRRNRRMNKEISLSPEINAKVFCFMTYKGSSFTRRQVKRKFTNLRNIQDHLKLRKRNMEWQ